MKTFLALLLTALTTCSGNTQPLKTPPAPDSTSIPNEQLRTGLRLIERAKLTKAELVVSNLRLSIMAERFQLKDSTVRAQDLMLVDLRNVVANKDREIAVEHQRTALSDDTNNELRRRLKAANRQTWWFTRGGILAVAAAAVLVLVR